MSKPNSFQKKKTVPCIEDHLLYLSTEHLQLLTSASSQNHLGISASTELEYDEILVISFYQSS